MNAEHGVVELQKMNKWYGNFHVLRNINFSVKREKIVICGPSGSGKSTMIRCINRLEEHQKGDIIVNGRTPHSQILKILNCGEMWVWYSSILICLTVC